MDFDKAIDIIFPFEGGYVDDPNDPGGETNFGISKRSYPEEDIKNMTKEKAKVIYKRDYWDKCGCDRIPDKFKLIMLDCAINQGVFTAQAIYQICNDSIVNFANKRLEKYQKLHNWSIYGKGWSRRLLTISLLSIMGF